MSQPESIAVQDTDETAQFDEPVTTSPILDPATVTSPADCGLNLSASVPEIASQKSRTRLSSAAPAKVSRWRLSGRLQSRKVRLLLTLTSLLLIVGLIGLNANRQPIVADSEADSGSLDLSEMGESAADGTTSDSLAEPRRHELDTPLEDHPLMRNAAQTRSLSGWSADSDWPATDAHSGIAPTTNYTDGPLPATASQPRQTPASGAQGAWLTGQIESEDSPTPSATMRNVSVNQAAPRLLRNGTRHPLAD